jgi:D-amino-acid oxidase
MPGELDINYTSPWAGAYYRSLPAVDSVSQLASRFGKVSYSAFKDLAVADPSSGVQMIDGYEYIEKPDEAYSQLQGGYSNVEGFRILRADELPAHVKFGVTYRTWSVDPSVYLPWLKQRLILGGAKFLHYNLVNILEAYTLFDRIDILVNCSGMGFSDPDVFPIRGF